MDLAQYIEHTLLKQDATKEELLKLFEEAKTYNFKGVCVNPQNVKLAYENLKDSNVKIVTVVGFPLGASIPESKAFEAKMAIEQGADEVDMVINITALKEKDYELVKNDIKAVKNACGDNFLKVIIETDLLTKEEVKLASELCVKGGADFVKTSTGFVKGGVGAKVEDVEVMYNTVKDAGLQVKASGGVRDKEAAIAMINAGAVRLGTSSGVKIVEG